MSDSPLVRRVVITLDLPVDAGHIGCIDDAVNVLYGIGNGCVEGDVSFDSFDIP